MKKIVFALIMLMGVAPAAFSQIVRSTTFTKAPKEKSKTEWFVRLGLSCNNLTGAASKEVNKEIKDEDDDDVKAGFGTRANYDLMFGFNKYFGKTDLYWGMEFGLGTRGGSFTSKGEYYGESFNEKCYLNTYNVKYTPFVIGYKYPINDDFKIDAHFGLFLSFDFAGSYTEDGWSKYDGEKETFNESWSVYDEDIDFIPVDGGIQLGIGVWYRKFNINFTWQRGFAPYMGSFPWGEEVYNRNDDRLWYNSSNAIISVAYAF